MTKLAHFASIACISFVTLFGQGCAVETDDQFYDYGANGLDPERYGFQRADVLQWLERDGDGKEYDLIFVAPPSYSRSKGMRKEFDIQRDHVWLLKRCGARLRRGGEMLFTTNLREFDLYRSELKGWTVEDLTEELTPADFANRPRLKIWSLKR